MLHRGKILKAVIKSDLSGFTKFRTV